MDFLIGLLAWSAAAGAVTGIVAGVGVYLFGIDWLTGSDTRHRNTRHNTVTGW